MSGALCTACGRVAPEGAITCPACGAWLAQEAGPDLPARVAAALGAHYRVDEEIGRGGYAVVYRVRDLRLERNLAAKALHPDLGAHPELAERFRREARLAAGLNHPNIVPIYFVGDDAAPCYVMPLINGETLAARLRREGQLALEVTLGIGRDLAAALDYAHAAGVVHRDVKPDNVVLEFATGRSMLTDFGIAKALATDTALTASGIIIGTPHYMSPEQAGGERAVDARSDVYSLGVVLYEMLAGSPPFDGATAHAIFTQHLGAEAPSIRARRPDLHESIDAVLRRALAKTPGDRYESAGAFLAALERAQGRRSLRGSGGTIVERQSTDDVRLFRSVGTATGSAAAAFRQAADVAAMAEALNAMKAAITRAQEALDVPGVVEALTLLASRADDELPALRQPVRDVLRVLAERPALVEVLAAAWRGGVSETQSRVEHLLRVLSPEVDPLLLHAAEHAKSPELFLLADRIGVLDDAAAEKLARHPSPAVAQAFGVAVRESTRPRTTLEHWLALLARHSHPGVRTLAVETAAAHGGGLGERVARLVLADPDAAARQAALRALGASRRREALPDLGRVLEHGSREDQCVAAEALGLLGHVDAAPILERVFARRRLFRAERGELQRAAAKALANLPEGAGAPALAKLTDDPDPEIRRLARASA